MLTLYDLQKMANGKPENLPVLYVHNIDTWTGPTQVDTKGRVHMNYTQMWALRKDLPLRLIRRIGPTTEEFKIDLQRHHLIGGPDKPVETVAEGQAVMMRKFGAANKEISKARKRKTALIKRPSNKDIH
ncbi:MAG: hypothetical protein L3J58_11690 [Emcibacter sp.]|nr:hypothetical protein [Emcibacter sp.]